MNEPVANYCMKCGYDNPADSGICLNCGSEELHPLTVDDIKEIANEMEVRHFATLDVDIIQEIF